MSTSQDISGLNSAKTTPEASQLEETDYSYLLASKDISFTSSEMYLHIDGETPTSRWIFHMSLVLSQFSVVADAVIDYCIKKKLAFRIPRNATIHKSILDGLFGLQKVGKIITIYIGKNKDPLSVGVDLINLGGKAFGPFVPTDYKLSSCVFTRWISEPSQKVSDQSKYSLPFTLPRYVAWPFETIVSFKPLPKRKLLKKRYFPFRILKSDPKGKVFIGIYMKTLLHFKWCLIKEGLEHMWFDDWGRDIIDRLEWQAWVAQQLSTSVSVPRVIDLMVIDGNGYLVTEFIEGQNLEHLLISLFKGTTWRSQKVEGKKEILQLLIQAFQIVQIMHEKGFVHRDVTPANFMVTDERQVYLIDLELTYKKDKNIPKPPFRLGTPGYMSPEQRNHTKPTEKEDVYAMGCFMLATLFRLSPFRIEIADIIELKKNLNYYIGYSPLELLILKSLYEDPSERPTAEQFIDVLTRYGTELVKAEKLILSENISCQDEVKEAVREGISCLGKRDLFSENGLWFSNTSSDAAESHGISVTKAILPGLYDGLSGILYAISAFNRLGYDVTSLLPAMENAMSFLYAWETSADYPPNLALSSGTAGNLLTYCHLEIWKPGRFQGLIAVAIKKLTETPIEDLSMSFGLAGIGIALGISCNVMAIEDLHKKIDDIESRLIAAQLRNGSWVLNRYQKASKNNLCLNDGVAGIIYSLLSLYGWSKNQRLIAPIEKGLHYLMKGSLKLKSLPYTEVSEILLKGRAGLALCYLKAFELIRNEKYEQAFVDALDYYPEYIHNVDLSIACGLSGLGQVYLEAFRCTQNSIWKRKALRIATQIIDYSKKSTSIGRYWISGNGIRPTAGYMNGNCGILHFLARCATTVESSFIPFVI